jgi:hypothetical protein
MAQTNYTPISLYYSTTAAATPTSGNLVSGELAINIQDEKLYFKNAAGTVKLLASNASSTGTVSSVAQTFTGGLISVAGSPITTSGTLALTVAGTSGGIPYFSSSSTWATSAALAANALLIGGGAGAAPASITTGTGVVTALGVNTGSAGAFVVNGGALGTPSSGTVTNLTGTASININGTVGATTATTGAFTSVTATSVTNSGLTNTRVTFAGASGLLSDSANLTWSGTALNVTGTVAVTGALTATLNSTFSSTGALTISKGTTGERPTAVSGMLRFNTTTTEFEGYNGTAWASVGGAALSNDTSTATNVYPLFANATTGTASTLFTGNAKLLYKPSTGEFQASVPVALNGIVVNSQTVSASYTIAAGYSAMSSGPVSVASGQAVTVSSGSRWVIV